MQNLDDRSCSDVKASWRCIQKELDQKGLVNLANFVQYSYETLLLLRSVRDAKILEGNQSILNVIRTAVQFIDEIVANLGDNGSHKLALKSQDDLPEGVGPLQLDIFAEVIIGMLKSSSEKRWNAELYKSWMSILCIVLDLFTTELGAESPNSSDQPADVVLNTLSGWLQPLERAVEELAEDRQIGRGHSATTPADDATAPASLGSPFSSWDVDQVVCADGVIVREDNAESPRLCLAASVGIRNLRRDSSGDSIGTPQKEDESAGEDDESAERKDRQLILQRWSIVSRLMEKRLYTYFRSFVPRIATLALPVGPPDQAAATEMMASEAELVVLLVDISGFTRLCDRFQALGQEGIDAFTNNINRIFNVILNHIASWGGDVIKFDGDALIVVWETGSNGWTENITLAVECARELEARHGSFQVQVPDVLKLAMADHVGGLLAAADLDAEPAPVARRPGICDAEVRRVLRSAAAFECLTEEEVVLLAGGCGFSSYREGDVVFRQGSASHTMYIIHSGEISVLLADDSHGPEPGGLGESRGFGSRIATMREGHVLGEIALLTGQPHTATALAAHNSSVVKVTARALQPVLRRNPRLLRELAAQMRRHLIARPRPTGAVTLRVHQSVAAGPLWLAHIGGERMARPAAFEPRREFLVMGAAIVRAGEALADAPVGAVVVARAAWQHVATRYSGEETPGGHWLVRGPVPGDEPVVVRMAALQRARLAAQPERPHGLWRGLRLYCHEGARELQEAAEFAADLRRVSVIFARLHLDLEKAGPETVRAAHEGLLTVQRAVYGRKGTLQKFLQDDKGLVAICVMGMPPLWPHDSDAALAVLAAIDLHADLARRGVRAGVGVTTGAAYSGFVGSRGRREMCAMGTTVNMAARLMCRAGDGILVDRATRDLSALAVEYAAREPVAVKGRDEPLQVFSPVGPRDPDEVQAGVLELVRREFGVRAVSEPVALYLGDLLRLGDVCSAAYVRGLCRSLADARRVHATPDGVLVPAPAVPAAGPPPAGSRGRTVRGGLESVPCAAQMLARVACLLSHRGVFAVATVRHVFAANFPHFAGHFDSALAHLVRRQLARPAAPDALAPLILISASHTATFDGTDPEPGVLWGWEEGELRAEVWARILGFRGRRTAAAPPPLVDERGGLSAELREFAGEPDPATGRRRVFVLPAAGLVRTVLDSLLVTYQRLWHRHAAEHLERVLDCDSDAAALVLAHHWAAALEDHRPVEPAHVAIAARRLHRAARAAAARFAFIPAMDAAHRATALLDLAGSPGPPGPDSRAAILRTAAWCSMMVYGPGSPEAVAAYTGLARLTPAPHFPLDAAGAAVLAGAAANLAARGLFRAATAVAQELVARAGREQDASAGRGLLSAALFAAGDVAAVEVLAGRLRKDAAADAAAGAAGAAPLTNGVVASVVGLCSWPAAVAARGDLLEAEAAAGEALAAAEACGHPPTLAYALAHLAAEYLRLSADPARASTLAARAEEIAAAHHLPHCAHAAAAARRWIAATRHRPAGSAASAARLWASAPNVHAAPPAAPPANADPDGPPRDTDRFSPMWQSVRQTRVKRSGSVGLDRGPVVLESLAEAD